MDLLERGHAIGALPAQPDRVAPSRPETAPGCSSFRSGIIEDSHKEVWE